MTAKKKKCFVTYTYYSDCRFTDHADSICMDDTHSIKNEK